MVNREPAFDVRVGAVEANGPAGRDRHGNREATLVAFVSGVSLATGYDLAQTVKGICNEELAVTESEE
jgi:hypothetical protein